MITRRILSCSICATLLLALGLTDVCRAELVVNGGFETGSFFGWASAGNNGFDGVTSPGPSSLVHSGNSAAFFGAVGAPSSLSQALATIPGERYIISFWLNAFGDNPSTF